MACKSPFEFVARKRRALRGPESGQEFRAKDVKDNSPESGRTADATCFSRAARKGSFSGVMPGEVRDLESRAHHWGSLFFHLGSGHCKMRQDKATSVPARDAVACKAKSSSSKSLRYAAYALPTP